MPQVLRFKHIILQAASALLRSLAALTQLE